MQFRLPYPKMRTAYRTGNTKIHLNYYAAFEIRHIFMRTGNAIMWAILKLFSSAIIGKYK